MAVIKTFFNICNRFVKNGRPTYFEYLSFGLLYFNFCNLDQAIDSQRLIKIVNQKYKPTNHMIAILLN